MADNDQTFIGREIDDATHMMHDRDRAIFMLGYALRAKQTQRVLQATVTALKNSVPGITGGAKTVRA